MTRNPTPSEQAGREAAQDDPMTMRQLWELPTYDRRAVLGFGGFLGAVCVMLAILATIDIGPWGLLFLLPIPVVMPIVFHAEALSAVIRADMSPPVDV